MRKIKINIQLFGGRGSTSMGSSTKSGKLRKQYGDASKYQQLDVSALKDFPVKLKHDFEKFMNMNAEEVEYGYLIDKNDRVVAGAKGDKHSVAVEYSGSEEGFTLTHNHPNNYGGTFSGADISHLTEAKLKSIRAVAKEGTYTMTATKKANYMGLNRALAKDINKINKTGASKAEKVRIKKGSQVAIRKAYVDTLHDWYKKNASKCGFTYSFRPNKNYKVK